MTQQPNRPPLPPPPPPPPQGPYGQGPYPPGQYPPPGYAGGPYPGGPYPGGPYPGGPQPLQYQSPISPYGARVACPKCGDPRSHKVGFTWWGGVLGPKILSHVKCVGCGTGYNGKTGKSNTTGIVIYTVVGLVIGLVLLAVFFAARFS